MAAKNDTSPSSERFVSPSKAILGLGTASLALLTATTVTGGLVETVLLAAGASGFLVAVTFGILYSGWQAIFHPEARGGVVLLVIMLICALAITPFAMTMYDRYPNYWGRILGLLRKDGGGGGGNASPVTPVPNQQGTSPPSSPSASATAAQSPIPQQQAHEAQPARFSKQTALSIVGGVHVNDGNIVLALRRRLTNAGFKVVDDPARAQAVVYVSFVRVTDPQPDSAGQRLSYMSSAVIRVSASWNDKRGQFLHPVEVEKSARTQILQDATLEAQSLVVQSIVDQLVVLAEK